LVTIAMPKIGNAAIKRYGKAARMTDGSNMP
jgi:hypothetical protein